MRVYFSTPDIEQLKREHMLVDMHFHSAASHDAATPVSDIIARAKHLGVRVALTDHNTIAGSLLAHKRAPGVVMPAVEITTREGKDVIPYFYTHADLEDFFTRVMGKYIKKKSSIRSSSTSISMPILIEELRSCNCVVTLPHPFAVRPRRSYSYFQDTNNRPLLKHVHAVEVINQSMLHRQNLAAIGWAMQFNKAIVGGSDGHVLKPLATALTVSPAQTWEEFLENVKAKRVAVIGEERRLGTQLMDTTKNATRILRQKANITRRREM